jgi:hypothetical protein
MEEILNIIDIVDAAKNSLENIDNEFLLGIDAD